jgi:uncharacterized membrane protein YhaH (DUF805 family)
MTFAQSIASGFRRYLDFKTRSSRSEYWWWTLFSMLTSAIATVCDEAFFGADSNPLYTLNALVLFIPGIAVAVRRLHDIDRSGWWFLLAFTVIGILLLLYWYIQPGTQGMNRYGHDPLKSMSGPYSAGTEQVPDISKRSESCMSCGTAIKATDNFCPSCGMKI